MIPACAKVSRSRVLGRIKGILKQLPDAVHELEAMAADGVPGAADALKRLGFARTALDRAQDALAEKAPTSAAPAPGDSP